MTARYIINKGAACRSLFRDLKDNNLPDPSREAVVSMHFAVPFFTAFLDPAPQPLRLGKQEFDDGAVLVHERQYVCLGVLRPRGRDWPHVLDDHIAFTIADVSGKGVPAALTMTISKIVIHDRALAGGTPAEILFDTNERICVNNKMERFITVWLGILDLKTGIVTYASAGHEYPAVKRKNGGYELVVSDNCPPVGTVTGIEYYDQTIDLSNGGSLFLYTDGVTDVKNAKGERFGIDHTLELLNGVCSLSAEETVEYIKNEIDTFVGDTDRFDDTTMMCIKYKG